MKLIVFTKKDCPQCPKAKEIAREVAEELGIELEEVDIEKDLITALQYNVASTPSIALGEEVLFRGEVPRKEDLRREILKLIK